ncbi:MAG TPA: hypothetical protein VD794_02275 [Flavisolibacter sp.]|nr:hypothetical protein [Flavisolibacter sp.]
MACSTLAKGVQASCAAIKKVGGVNKRVYIGLLEDLATAVFGTGNILTSITFNSGKGLVKYEGRKEKNSAGVEIERGENVNIRNQTVTLAVYYSTAEQLSTLDDLIDTEGLFAIIETAAGVLEVYGLNKSGSFDSFGLVASGSKSTGTVLQDSTAFNLTLTGGHTNMELHYNPVGSLTTNIAALDALTIDPAPEV